MTAISRRTLATLRRIGLAVTTATCVAVGTVGAPVNAGIRPQAGPCGVRVYMTGSGPGAGDATNDTAVKTSLENGTTLCITIGVGFYDLSTVSGSVTTSNYDVIYLQGQNNWQSTYLNQFDASDLAVIDTFLTNGGGLVVGEWHAWNACAKSLAGAWGGLDALMPVSIRSGCAYGSSQNVRFYRWARPLSALIDTGVAADFVFQPADFAGSLSFLTLKTGATPYYWATWDPVVANIPAAVDPANLPSAGGLGMAGWVPTGKTGRVFSFSTTNGAPELQDTSASNSFRRLLVNALGWSGSVGGSVNPDAIAVSTSAGGSVSTPALVPTKMVGQVTYSIVSGTLPTGLSLNTSTGSITGTSSQGGSYTVTIQGTGATSGTAQAIVSFTITGGATTTTTTTTTVASTTTTTGSGTSGTTTTVASVANVNLSTDSGLPTAGTSTLPAVWFALAMIGLGTVLYLGRRRI